MQISQIWMQIKDILSVLVKQWVLFHQYPEHQFFFFSTTVAISSRRLSPLSLAAILVVTNGRLNDKENTFSLTFSTAERPKEVQNTKQNVVKYILMTTAINCF